MTVRRPAPDFSWWLLRAHWGAGLPPLFFAGSLPIPVPAVAAVAFLAGVALDLAEAPRARWSRWAAPVLAGSFLAAMIDLLAGSRDPLRALSFLVLVLQSVRFILPKSSREGWQLCALSYLEFLTAASTTPGIHFGLHLFVYVGLSAGAMAVLSAAGPDLPGSAGRPPLEPARGARWVAAASAAGFLFTTLFFALTPRMGLARFTRLGAPPERLSGFSGAIRLQDVAAVKADRTVVARVEFPVLPPGAFPEMLYLKGATYSRFDGAEWRRGTGIHARVLRSGLVYEVSTSDGPGLLAADISLEPMEPRALFYYGSPLSIEGDLGDLISDGDGGFVLPSEGSSTIRYRLRATLASSRSRGRTSLPAEEHLRIPAGWDDLRDLAARVTAGARTDPERADRLRRHLRSGYRYTLDDPAPSVRDFLFRSRAGFCEHYATSLALLLRAAGIPSRVAAGYLGGEWSGLGQYLIVRQAHAHAWTEAWLGGEWVALDATPPGGRSAVFGGGTGAAGLALDWLKQRWNKYVVNYSLGMQAEGLWGGWSALKELPGRLRGALRQGPGKGRRAAAGLAVFLAILPGFLVLRRRSWRGRTPERPDDAGPRAAARFGPYARLARRLADRGHRPSAGTPLAGMLRSAVSARPELAVGAARFIELYHRDRFGARPLAPSESREAARLAAELRRAAPAGRGTGGRAPA